MRATLLLNPRSGTLLGQPDLPARIEEALRGAGFDLTVVPPGAAPDFPGRLDAALAGGAPLLLVGGGDGTIRAAAARLMGTDTVLGVLPLGTLNLLARDLGLPLDPEAAARALAGAEIRAVDVATVNDEIFLCQSVIGMPNRIGLHRERLRGIAGPAKHWRVAVAVLRAFWRHPPLRLALRVEDDVERPAQRVWTRALSVVNNDYEEAPGQMFHRPCLDGGHLALHVARDFGLWWAVKLLLAMAAGHWRGRPELFSRRARRVTILSRRRHLRVMNDGEAQILRTPLEYRIHPRALRVLVPAGPSGPHPPETPTA